MDKIKSFVFKVNERIAILGERISIILLKLFNKIKKILSKIRCKVKIESLSENKRNLITGYISVAVVLISIFGIYNKCFNINNYKDVIEIYLEAGYGLKPEKMLEIMPKAFLDELRNEFITENSNATMDDVDSLIILELRSGFKDELEELNDKCGYGWDYKYDILEERDYTKEEIKDNFSEYYMLKDTPIKKAKNVWVNVKFYQENKKVHSDAFPISVVKIGFNWYYLP